MRFALDLIGTFLKNVLMFPAMIIGGILGLALVLFYVASAAFLFVSVMSGLLYLYGHSPALLHVSMLYFGYAAVAFAIPSVFFRLPGAIEAASKRRQQKRMQIQIVAQPEASFSQVEPLRLATDTQCSRHPDAVSAALHRLNTAT